MPTRYLRGVPPEDWPPEAVELDRIFKQRDRELLTPAWFGIPPQSSYSAKELAGYLNCSSDTIERLIEEGVLIALRVNHQHRVPWLSLCRYFMKQQGIFN
jgi:excisionase family DNA binding protein